MKLTQIYFRSLAVLGFGMLVPLCSAAVPLMLQQTDTLVNSISLAKKHGIVFHKPAVDFFEGALLGNGAMGVVVNTRPDAVLLRFGHNNIWDIRLAEHNKKELGTFQSVFDKVKDIDAKLPNLTDDAWYNAYNRMSSENYSKPYPRPFPSGSVLLGFDRRKIQLLGHELDISVGLCTVKLLTADGRHLFLKIFTDMLEDRLWMRLTDAEGKPHANVFNRVRVLTDPSTPGEFPQALLQESLQRGMMSFRQVLPRQESGKADSVQGNDRAFRLTLRVNDVLMKKSRTNWNGNQEDMAQLEAALTNERPFLASVSLEEGLADLLGTQLKDEGMPAESGLLEDSRRSMEVWREYWNKSGVSLSDSFLEEMWYRNLYFFNCAAKAGVTCPGLFANWSYGSIGTAWHGDYHMNYNTQQPFWMTFSSNHLEKNTPYVDLIEALMPVSRKWAADYYGLPGAYFPHSAFPVEMTMNPYPVPDWGWELSETPWAVQGLWWHYLYSGDQQFLADKAYEPLKAAVEFLVAYMMRDDAHGGTRWKDNRYHIFPSVPPELYGLRPGFKYNYDNAVDLTLTKFAFHAFKQATGVLKTTGKEKALLKKIDLILANYPDYPEAVSAKYGRVMVSVPEEHDEIVYNVPNALITVFPGEDFGLHSSEQRLELLRNTYRNQQNEGGNDLVFINLQAARIGMLDLEEFKRQVSYCLLPNGTATDMVMQTGGRYNDHSDFGYMSKMGVWFENFALPAVVNECLLQGYQGTLRFFPNWPKDKDASFSNLRAAGAFLVSARLEGGKVAIIEVLSEKGSELSVEIPWQGKTVVESARGKAVADGKRLKLKTHTGERLRFYPQQ
ncbi:hypothetical protein PBAL39_05078 [Pedobacter sp. BAL39]|uniref:glycosyl hydrolase family 95 catalytic domain-containing protein n=1 Tax=Pedobacter sp. BAL39 TaxID=391596 RepID=UPI00015594F7|nr:glycoside hydrolase N-terminal domain-containing protein [Pedobacter sp. BAL39]EDM37144.1 hypothetical protein PBAL39_05078 [Pedobacter sp. BAL39]